MSPRPGATLALSHIPHTLLRLVNISAVWVASMPVSIIYSKFTVSEVDNKFLVCSLGLGVCVCRTRITQDMENEDLGTLSWTLVR